MKKLFILSGISIFLLTGCGANETLSCSYNNNADNGTSNVKYDIEHDGDEIKKVRITYNYDFSNNNTGNGTDTGNDAGNATTRNRTTNGNTYNNDTTTNGNNNSGISDDDMTGNTDNGNMTRNTTDNGVNTTNDDGMNNNTNNNKNTHTDGIGTGTDGTTNDTDPDDDGIVDGLVGSAIDAIVGGVTDVILDSAGLRDRHNTVQNTYGNVPGFSVMNTNDANDKYSVTYVIDYDTISDTDLARFNLSRDLDELRDSYTNQGFTCK